MSPRDSWPNQGKVYSFKTALQKLATAHNILFILRPDVMGRVHYQVFYLRDFPYTFLGNFMDKLLAELQGINEAVAKNVLTGS